MFVSQDLCVPNPFHRKPRQYKEKRPVALLQALHCLLVRPSGFEPPRGCPRQPLKLVRLPFRHDRIG